MKCPDCQEPLHEGVRACSKCGFTLDQVQGLGRMPNFKGVITDASRVLTRLQAGKLRADIRRFVRQFPQVRFNVLLTRLDPEMNLQKYAFWVFNHGSLCSSLEKGGLNFQLLLIVDTDQPRANLSIGYGLEPFVSEAHLEEILQAGQDALSRDEFAEAVQAILAAGTERLHEIGKSIPETYGMRPRTRPSEF